MEGARHDGATGRVCHREGRLEPKLGASVLTVSQQQTGLRHGQAGRATPARLLAALPGIGTWDTLEEISKLCGE
jgi:hypothetical protein